LSHPSAGCKGCHSAAILPWRIFIPERQAAA
jgi:hypothetical protein